MTSCKCDYNLLRKGLADEKCPECYQAFVDKEEMYYKMLDSINALMVLFKDSEELGGIFVFKSTVDQLFKEFTNVNN